MKIRFLTTFNKDLSRIKDSDLKERVVKIIQDIESIDSIYRIKNIKKLKGDKISYRIRLGDYRIGIFYEKDFVELVRIVHRKDIYKVFP